ncbi:hypothetical protein SAMN06269250_6315 [Spirosoma fluviale]|uniref:Uncharacterized protein n=1 Tax=Spirosoma fluviale TaxID=1597977 RepID=A0A286GUP9_9BACT|nr:hypothetical protein SAMN06269250_6315 [Spirosoma fluviale]
MHLSDLTFLFPKPRIKVTRLAILEEIYYLNRRLVHAKERSTDSIANFGILPQKFVSKSCFVVSKLQVRNLIGSD